MNNGKIINFDFEGWPVEKMAIRDILKALGAEQKSINNKVYWAIPESPALDTYPIILEDDGMGYGVNGEFITEVSIGNDVSGSYCNMFRERELDYVSVWLECKVQPGSFVNIDGKTWILTDVDETDDGFVFFANEWCEISEERPKTYTTGETKAFPMSIIKNLNNG